MESINLSVQGTLKIRRNNNNKAAAQGQNYK